tara:strand:+ start:706 stop:945 length:240 start_codon:yes stop_codon:yes gene_type:complete
MSHVLELPTLDADEAVQEYLRLYDLGVAKDGRVVEAITYAEKFGFTLMDRSHFLATRSTGARLLRKRVGEILLAIQELG